MTAVSFSTNTGLNLWRKFILAWDVLIMFPYFHHLKDSKLDVTIGPYETYEDALFGYKVSFCCASLSFTSISNNFSSLSTPFVYTV